MVRKATSAGFFKLEKKGLFNNFFVAHSEDKNLSAKQHGTLLELNTPRAGSLCIATRGCYQLVQPEHRINTDTVGHPAIAVAGIALAG